MPWWFVTIYTFFKNILFFSWWTYYLNRSLKAWLNLYSLWFFQFIYLYNLFCNARYGWPIYYYDPVYVQIILVFDASTSILCLTSRRTVTSARISKEDTCHRTRNLCVFSRVQKWTPGLMHKGCVLQRVSLGALSEVTVVLGMRQSIATFEGFNPKY